MLRATTLALLLLTTTAFCQPRPDTLWTTMCGDSTREFAYDILPLADGGYVLTGAHDYDGNRDMSVIKLDSLGHTVWSRTFGEQGAEQGSAIVRCADGGFGVTGVTSSYSGNADMYLVRIDSSGNLMWAAAYGGPGSDAASGLVLMPDGGFAVAGYTTSFGAGGSDWYLVRTDENGDTLWTRTYGTSDREEATGIVRTADGRFAMVGVSGSGYYPCMALLITDSLGNNPRGRTYTLYDTSVGWAIALSSDGGFFLAGYCGVMLQWADMRVSKTDSAGVLQWNRVLTHSGNEFALSVIGTADNGCVIAGSSGGSYLARMDSVGSLQWERNYGGGELWSLKPTADSGYVAAGYGLSVDHHSLDPYVVKTGPDETLAIEPRFNPQPSSLNLSCSPNPFNSELRIEYELPKAQNVALEVYNLLGQRVATLYDGTKVAGAHTITWTPQCGTGIYFVRLETADAVRTSKVIYLR